MEWARCARLFRKRESKLETILGAFFRDEDREQRIPELQSRDAMKFGVALPDAAKARDERRSWREPAPSEQQ
jgi:hypothetical protein